MASWSSWILATRTSTTLSLHRGDFAALSSGTIRLGLSSNAIARGSQGGDESDKLGRPIRRSQFLIWGQNKYYLQVLCRTWKIYPPPFSQTICDVFIPSLQSKKKHRYLPNVGEHLPDVQYPGLMAAQWCRSEH